MQRDFEIKTQLKPKVLSFTLIKISLEMKLIHIFKNIIVAFKNSQSSTVNVILSVLNDYILRYINMVIQISMLQ